MVQCYPQTLEQGTFSPDDVARLTPTGTLQAELPCNLTPTLQPDTLPCNLIQALCTLSKTAVVSPIAQQSQRPDGTFFFLFFFCAFFWGWGGGLYFVIGLVSWFT